MLSGLLVCVIELRRPGLMCAFVGSRDEVVILLAGGDKSSQTQDIKLAKTLAREL